eukprot:CAMPEP_0118654234 /NCGR_PEP_ID=MMETSP0785-20121206/12279_1 /TAXON_ID=91992 /ORGANISM="Bolidomonas pacifica, Strain CCMP 1866" /LENGTH=355 /DNA_ID=CAMNT_0006546877 /DNA_START=62 /DNA_END=1125 /DNA_ORIENTATION=-
MGSIRRCVWAGEWIVETETVTESGAKRYRGIVVGWETKGGRTKVEREFESLENAVYGIVPGGGKRYQAAGVTEDGEVRYFSHMQTVGLGVNSKGEVVRSQGGCEIFKSSTKSIDDVMRDRAERGYGIDAAKNVKICEETGEKDLAKIWRFVGLTNTSLPGVTSQYTSETNVVHSTSSGVKTYTSQARDTASLLCDNCSLSETFERVCAGDIEGAIETAPSVELKLAMMSYGSEKFESLAEQVLEGCGEEDIEIKYCLWHLLSGLRKEYGGRIVGEKKVEMRTRVGYALRFLDSQELKRWGRKCTEMSIKEGDLEGLIFTGANDRGLEIMQSYLDHTSDIQTVASIVGRCIMVGEG